MRISDWSSDVCSSDLDQPAAHRRHDLGLATDDPALRVARGKGTKRQRLAQRADDPERLNLAMGEHIDLQVTLHGARLPSAEVRSEEHTSELQSLMRISYAVFCLYKKNIKDKKKNN